MAPRKKKPRKSLDVGQDKSQESSDEDWEEVEEDVQLDDIKVDIKKDVEIEFELPDIVKKKQNAKSKVQKWLLVFFKRSHNKYKKQLHIEMHKVHLMCQMCVAFQFNSACNNEELQAIALSYLPTGLIHISSKNVSTVNLTKFVSWIQLEFFSHIKLKKLKNEPDNYISTIPFSLEEKLASKKLQKIIDLVQIYLLFLRSLGLQVRLVASLQPMSFKPPTEKQILEKQKRITTAMNKLEKYKKKNQPEIEKNKEIKNLVNKMEVAESIPQVDGANDEDSSLTLVRRSARNKEATKASATIPKKLATKKINKFKPAPKKKSILKGRDVNLSDHDMSDFEEKPPTKTSKYNFKSDGDKSLSDENIPVSTKLSVLNKRKQTVVKPKESTTMKDKKPTVVRKRMRQKRVDTTSVKEEEKDTLIPATTEKKLPKVVIPKSEGNIQNKNISVNDEVKNISDLKPKQKASEKPKRKTTKKQALDKNANKIKSKPKNGKLSDESGKEGLFEPDSESDSASSYVSENSESFSDSDFEEVKPVVNSTKKATNAVNKPSTPRKVATKRPASKSKSRSTITKPVSTLSDINHWIEVLIPERGWTSINCITGEINQPSLAEAKATKPLSYVLAFDNDNSIKDVTARYASCWLTTTRKLRIASIETNWWKNTLLPYKMKNKDLDLEENSKLQSDLMSKPLPTSISLFKDHPLFVLRRHLLKYEAIYPPDSHPVGFIRGEEVLARSTVHTLHTREKWMQSALSVKDGEEPYKMVASYLLNKKLNRDTDALSLALFGKWQTRPYDPPWAENGIVPRSQYGNVDLFKPCMIPKGCVHLRLEGIQNVARKLNIDIASAVVGFDTHHGFPHTVMDGHVVCAEFEETLRLAWQEDQAHAAERAREKLEKKIYLNWRNLIRGILTMERVRNKFENGESNENDQAENITSGASWQTDHLKVAKKKKGERKRRGGAKKKKADDFPFEVEEL